MNEFFKPLRVKFTRRVNFNRRWMSLFVIGALLISSLSLTPVALASTATTNCPSKYTVQRGDTMKSIAEECGVSLDSLIKANPQVTDPDHLYAGTHIYIPGAIIPITGTASVQLSPNYGQAGARVTVKGSAFPANASIYINVGQPGATPALTFATSTGDEGSFSALATIPSNASQGSVWTITAFVPSNSGVSASAQFQVTENPPSGAYIVQRGDTLSSIALKFGTTLKALLRANPQISNPNVLTPGEPVYIPGSLVVLPNGQPVYIVKSGDYLGKIAAQLGTTIAVLLQLNPDISNPSLITPGQYINIPGGIIPITGSTPERISFAPGTTSKFVTGNLQAGASKTYVLRAGAGQVMEVYVSPDQGLTLAIYGANGALLKSSASEANSYRGTLPRTQDYLLVLAASQNVDYTVSVDIPARISFAPGGTSAQVSGSLAAYGSQFYILRALYGQQLNVSVTPSSGVRLVIYGKDGTVLKSGMGESNSFSGYLPGTQDYIFVLSSDSQARSYSMRVTIPALGTPGPGQTVYIVQRGDTLSQIARRFGITLSALLQANPQITNPSRIFPGQRIIIP
jgi:LysM repeat protein